MYVSSQNDIKGILGLVLTCQININKNRSNYKIDNDDASLILYLKNNL